LTVLVVAHAPAQTASFTYQGRLTSIGSPAQGLYDMRFKLFDGPDVGSGTQWGNTLTNAAVPVTNGVFTVSLNFGAAVFDGSSRYLEMAVKPSGSPEPYDLLAPRQQVASTPHSIRSLNAAQLEGNPAASFLRYDDFGRVGVGTSAPLAPLHVNGDLRYEGKQSKLDVDDNFTATVRAADFLFGHSTRRGAPGKAIVDFGDKLHFNFAGEWTNTILGGDVGIGTINPVAALHAETSASGKAAVYGKATAASGVGLYGENTTPSSGVAIHAQGHARQMREGGGFAKAMLVVAADGNITRCYNGVTGSSGGDCGLTCTPVTYAPGLIAYLIDFDFKVDDRFVVVTTERSGTARTGANVQYGGGISQQLPNRIEVYTFTTDDGEPISAGFTVIVY